MIDEIIVTIENIIELHEIEASLDDIDAAIVEARRVLNNYLGKEQSMKDEHTAAMLGEVIAQTYYEIDQLLNGEDFKTHLSRIESCAREIIDLVEKYK